MPDESGGTPTGSGGSQRMKRHIGVSTGKHGVSGIKDDRGSGLSVGPPGGNGGKRKGRHHHRNRSFGVRAVRGRGGLLPGATHKSALRFGYRVQPGGAPVRRNRGLEGRPFPDRRSCLLTEQRPGSRVFGVYLYGLIKEFPGF